MYIILKCSINCWLLKHIVSLLAFSTFHPIYKFLHVLFTRCWQRKWNRHDRKCNKRKLSCVWGYHFGKIQIQIQTMRSILVLRHQYTFCCPLAAIAALQVFVCLQLGEFGHVIGKETDSHWSILRPHWIQYWVAGNGRDPGGLTY